MKELVLGGVRSGKSGLAAHRAAAYGGRVTVIATATAGGDNEMQRRIAEHRAARPPEWRVVEEPLALARALLAETAAERCVIVECLTLWLSRLVLEAPDALAGERAALLEVMPELPGHVIFVANETNLGVHPMGEAARRFCDEAGRLHQRVAAACDRVTLMVAGLPVALKGSPA